MSKSLFVFILFNIVFCLALKVEDAQFLGLDENEKRLFEYIDLNNNTVRSWMTLAEVAATLAECGKADPSRVQNHGGFFDVTDHPNLTLSDPLLVPAAGYIPKTLTQQEYVNTLVGAVNMANVRQTIVDLSKLFTRYYTTTTGVEGSNYIYNKFNSYIQSSGNKDASVAYFRHSWAQQSVIATIKGTSNEVVIIGAHQDSIRSGAAATGQAPGADDDASGTGAIVEIFRVLVSDPSFKPRRTVAFHSYSAEEVGLRGSQDIATNYQNNRVVVAGMMQLDMVGYKNGPPAIVTDYVNKDLTNFVIDLTKTYSSVAWTTTTCGYGCSDHASWTKAGYPSSFPFEASFNKDNPNIHTAKDVVDILDMNHAGEFVKLGIGFITELAK